MALVYCSDPSTHSVAPFGAVTPVFTPNPLAAGIPTSGDPILLDVSASYTTNGMTTRLHKAGETLPHPWVQDADGNADARSRRAVRRAQGHAAAARRPRSRAQGLRARAADRGADGGTRRSRARRSGRRLGRDGVRAGARPGGVRRRDGVRHADGLARARVPRRDAAAGRTAGAACRASARLRRYRDAASGGRRALPGIMPALAPWAEKLGVSPPGGNPRR